MTTERELIEAAAKAAGFTYWRSKHGYINLTLGDPYEATRRAIVRAAAEIGSKI